MRIYIDEAGPFLPPQPPRSLFSLVLSLIIPSSVEQELFYEFLRLRDTWPNQSVEIKGSSLNESQAAQLISLVLKYDTLVQFIALDANTHPDTLVEDFKERQADGVTANITREHHPGPIPHLHQLGESVRRMSNQLFLQSFATWELIIRTIREGTVYFVQRQPEELGDIAWLIDRGWPTHPRRVAQAWPLNLHATQRKGCPILDVLCQGWDSQLYPVWDSNRTYGGWPTQRGVRCVGK